MDERDVEIQPRPGRLSMVDDDIVALLREHGVNAEIVEGQRVTILGVPYVHIRFPNQDDLYLTRFGEGYIGNLVPEQYTGKRFDRNSRRLRGTSCVYQIPTGDARGRHLDIVLKWNRMAQDVPGSTGLIGEPREFNSPKSSSSCSNSRRLPIIPSLASGSRRPWPSMCPAKGRLFRSGAGFEDIDLRGNHTMLAFDKAGHIVGSALDNPDVRIGTFESLRRL